MKSMLNKALLLTLVIAPAFAVANENAVADIDATGISMVEEPRVKSVFELYNEKVRARNEARMQASRRLVTPARIALEQESFFAPDDAKVAAAERMVRQQELQQEREVAQVARNKKKGRMAVARGLVASGQEIDTTNMSSDMKSATEQAIAESNMTRFQRAKRFVGRNVSKAYTGLKHYAKAGVRNVKGGLNYAWNNPKNAAFNVAVVVAGTYLTYQAAKAVYTKAKKALGYSTKVTKKKKARKRA
ncbi:MAG TPA: hypothetical protein VLG71_00985 [Candidatus Limnocylindria bacterium]|nr:hypothetical protein [Candidatus Limnocylindria bacterium]